MNQVTTRQSNYVQDRIKELEISSTDLINDPGMISHFMEISNDYLCIFNDKLELIECNNTCLKPFKDTYISKEFLIGKTLFFYANDFEITGAYQEFKKTSERGNVFELNDYPMNSSIYKGLFNIQLRMFKYNDLVFLIASDITEQRRNSQEQKDQINELTQKCNNLENALDVFFTKFEQRQNEIKKNYYSNLEELVFPMLNLLKNYGLDSRVKEIVDVLESTLMTITDPFSRSLNNAQKLTQREIEIANLIRMGKTTKEISEILYLSGKTVDFHRVNIRKKLEISKTKDNLRSVLLK